MTLPLDDKNTGGAVESAKADVTQEVVASVSAPVFKGGITTHLHIVDPRTLAGKVTAQLLRRSQDGMIFNPHPAELEKLESDPLSYPELEGLGLTSRKLVTECDKKGHPTAEITLWEREGNASQPHYIIFTGKTGHIIDTGDLPPGVEIPGYDRHAGIELMQQIAKTGAGVTVVTMRGYGNNIGKPSEAGFQKDIAAFYADWKQRAVESEMGTQSAKLVSVASVHKNGVAPLAPRNAVPSAKRTIVAGVSLGTCNAAYLANLMGKDGQPPALLALVNPYKEFVDAAAHTLENTPFKHAPFVKRLPLQYQGKVRGLSFHVPRENLDQWLNHNFRTSELLPQLDKRTHLHVVTSGQDQQIPPENSAALMDVAKRSGLTATQTIYPDCGHLDWPIAPTVKAIQGAFDRAHEAYAAQQPEDIIYRDGVATSAVSKLYTPPDRDKASIDVAARLAELRRPPMETLLARERRHISASLGKKTGEQEPPSR